MRATTPEYGPTRVVVAGANFVPTAQLACFFGDEQAAWLGLAVGLGLGLGLGVV